MATLISFYKDNKITSSEVESKDIDIVLGFLFKNYILGEDITENFDSKFLYIEDSKFKMKPLNKKIKTFSQEKEDSVEVLIQFEELAKGYEAAYIFDQYEVFVSVPYRGATFLNFFFLCISSFFKCFRPLSGSYISQYHPRNPMSCLGRIGGLRGKSNFIEMQPFWKVKNSHKSSI